MSISKSDYSKMTDKASPNSPVILNCIKAFIFDGGLCTLAELMSELFEKAGLGKNEVRFAVPSLVIVITAILTGLGVYDKIARHAGAGTIVPISGFSNSVVAPALEFQHEGYVLGTAAQTFSIAGPVIVYGTATSVVYGLIYYLATK
ncbi:MAG: SpoVA/SpoVAEb family sporulation membrane protein [Eubacterium sp.]|nr:SpoVA/SpoVAEb family sporulation membrane protein [Eubacterium sp.]